MYPSFILWLTRRTQTVTYRKLLLRVCTYCRGADACSLAERNVLSPTHTQRNKQRIMISIILISYDTPLAKHNGAPFESPPLSSCCPYINSASKSMILFTLLQC